MEPNKLSQILISVIVPVYNDELFIKETLLSITNQTHKNTEIIVVNDCSADNSLNIINSLKIPNLILFTNKTRKGAAYSRNLGIRNAHGEYIAFLDGDDLWKQTKLEEQLKFMDENKYSFSSTFYSLIDKDGKSLNKTITSPKIITHRRFLQACYIGCLTAMYKRSIYPDLQIPETIKKRNDYALWLKLSEKTHCYAYPKVLANYRKRTNSISSGRKKDLFKYHVFLYKELYKCSSLKAFLLSLRNVFYYFYKNIIFKK